VAKKIFKLVWECRQLLSRFLVKSHLPQVLHQSRLSANDKGDNEMIPGAVHRSPSIYLTAEEKLRKLKLGARHRRLYNQSSLKMGFLTSK
jgi:hypothetical protein